MESIEIISRLENKGFEVSHGKYEYWENVPYVQHEEGNKTYLAKTYNKMGSAGIERNVSFEKAKQAVERKCIDINDLEQKLLDEKINREAEEMVKKFN